MTDALFSVKLTLPEIIHLDGHCRDEIQQIVDMAKTAQAISDAGLLSEKEASMVAELVVIATTKGRLTWSQQPIRNCPCCGRNDGYHLVARNTQYKVKGRPDYDKPKMFTGYDLDSGFIHIQGHISRGCCGTCSPRIAPVLLQRLDGIRAELPEKLTGRPSRFKRYDRKQCTVCQWEGHEGELLPLPSVMGANYPGKCPSCGAENRFLGATKIKTVEGFTIVEIQP